MNRDQIISLFVAVYLAVYASVGVDTLRWLMGGPVSLLPALLVYSAIQHPSFWGVTIVGVVGGLLQDSFSSTPLGISVAALFAVGFTLNRKREYVMHQLPFARMLLGGIVGFVVPLLGFILTVLTESPAVSVPHVVWRLFVSAAFTAIATPLIFRLFQRLHRTFSFRTICDTSVSAKVSGT